LNHNTHYTELTTEGKQKQALRIRTGPYSTSTVKGSEDSISDEVAKVATNSSWSYKYLYPTGAKKEFFDSSR